MFRAGQPLRQPVNHHSQPCSSALPSPPTPPPSTFAAASQLFSASQPPLLLTPQDSSQAQPARVAVLDLVSPNSTPNLANGITASVEAKSTGSNNCSQLNEFGGALQLSETPTAPAAAKPAQVELQQQTPSSSVTASHLIVSGKFYSSSEYSTQYRPHLLSTRRPQQPHSANSDLPVVNPSAPAPVRVDHPIQGPAYHHNPSPMLEAVAPPSHIRSLLQETQQNCHRVRGRGVATVTTRSVMESTHYQLNPSTSTFPHHSHLSSQQQQHQQPHTRADTTVASSLNSSSTASKSGSVIIAASGSLSPYGSPRIAAPNFSATGPVRQPLPAQSQQSHPPYQRAPPKGSSLSPRFSVSNTSMSCSSVEDTGNSCLNPRAIYPGDVREHHRQTAPGPQQQQQRCHREVMDTVSRNLNTHNEPELEGLQSIHQDGEDEDMMAGHPSTAAGAVAPATTLYSKGFLISTTSSVKDLPVPCCNKGGGAYIPPHLHSNGDQQPPSDDGDASFSQTSESRGPTASTSTGISHRLLTLEEINERRRASWAASHSASHAQSVTTGTAAGDNAGGQKGGENRLSNTSNNNPSTVGGVSKGSRPPHRQLMREEADQLIAKRQQQRAAAVVATTKDFSVRQQQQQPHKLPLSSTHTTTSNNNQSVLLPPSLSDNAKPWLLSEDGTQANYFPTAPGSAQQVVHTSPMGGIGNTGTKPVTFEWLRGGGGGGTNSSGTGFFAEAVTHSWSGANTWRDPNAAGNSGSGSNTNINTAIAAFLGAAGGTPGDGISNSDLKTAVNNLGVAGRTPSVVSSAGLTWLPNTSCWTNSHNNNQQQQQQQAFLAFAPSAPPPMDHVTSTTNVAAWGCSAAATTTTSNFPGGSLRRNSLTMAPPPTANTALQELPREHIEARIQQCDMQLERLRQEREHLAEELQRRIYASASADQQQQRHHTNNAATTNATSWPSTLGRKNVTIPPRVTNGVTTGLAARPLSTETAGTGSITSVSGSVGQNPLWQFWGSPVEDNGVIKTPSRTTGETHEPPVTCTDSIVKIDGQDWVPRPTTTVMGQAASLAAGGAGAVYKGGAKNTGNWPASERSGARGCHRSEAGNNTSNGRSVHAHTTGRSHGSRSHINNTSSSPTGVGVTISKSGGGGKVMHNRCSHDNTPQDQKYLQTDPFSMYMHNKKLITAQQASSGDAAKPNAAQQSTA